MAAVQRKLVHKQFNSPIGLYSDQNVKETLNRELRAFSNGTVGIELNDTPRSPYNLANSSVLKMVEEEDYEKTHPARPSQEQRESRPRQRRPIITREDVLKINRRHPKRRDISWPPFDDHSRSRSTSDEIHFDERIRKRHEIFHLTEMSDRGAIAATATTNKKNNSRSSTQTKTNDTHSPSCSSQHDEGTNQSGKRLYRHRSQSAECPPKSYFENNESDDRNNSSRTCCVLPETELHIGNVGSVRNYWQNISKRSSSADSRQQPARRRRQDDALQRWHSHENLTCQHSPWTESLSSWRLKVHAEAAGASRHKKDNLPLERYKSNSYNELPPLKPRRENHKDLYHTSRKLNVNNAVNAVGKLKVNDSCKSRQNSKLGIRDCQTAIVNKANLQRGRLEPQRTKSNCYAKPTDAIEGEAASINHDPEKVRAYSLTSSDNRNASKNTTPLSHNVIDFSDSQMYPNNSANPTNTCGNGTEDTLTDTGKLQKDTTTRIAQTPLISLSNKQDSNQNYYHSEDTNLIAPNVRRDENLRHEKISQVLVSPKRHGNEFGTSNEEKYESKNERTTYQDYSKSSILTNSRTHQQQHRAKAKVGQKRVNFSANVAFGADITNEEAPTIESKNDSESLLLQRSLVEQAITHDIRKINEYMKRAELEALKASEYAKESFAITPLQAILQKIAPAHTDSGNRRFPSWETATAFPSAIAVIQVENTPVVDQALLDLLALSVALKALDEPARDPHEMTRITELHSDGNEERNDTATTSVDTISPVQNTETDSDSLLDPESEPVETQTDNTISRSASTTSLDKIIHSKNILSGYLITKQSQEDLLKNMNSTEKNASPDAPDSDSVSISEQSSHQNLAEHIIPVLAVDNSMSEQRNAADNEYIPASQYDVKNVCRPDADLNTVDSNFSREHKVSIRGEIRKPFFELNDSRGAAHAEKNAFPDRATLHPAAISNLELSSDVQNMAKQISEQQRMPRPDAFLSGRHSGSSSTLPSHLSSSEKLKGQPLQCTSFDTLSNLQPNSGQDKGEQLNFHECVEIDSTNRLTLENHRNSAKQIIDIETIENYNEPELEARPTDRGRGRARLGSDVTCRFRSSSQPCGQTLLPHWTLLNQQHYFTSDENWYSRDSSVPYNMTDRFSPAKGYKRVAWPPADASPVYSTVPQAQNPPASIYEVSSQAQQNPSYTNYPQQQQTQQQYQPKPQYNQPQKTQYQQPQYQQHQTQYHQPQSQYQQPQAQYQQPQTQYQKPQYQQSHPHQQQSQSEYEQSHAPYQQPQQSQYQAPRYESSPAPQYQSSAPQNNYSSTVSFSGGVAKSRSPSRPIAREYTPGRIQVPGQYQAPAPGNFEALSPQSSGVYTAPSQPSPQSPSPMGWSHVRGPTPTRIGYTMPGSSPQYQRNYSAPQGSESYYGAYQNNYQPQATQAFQPVNHQPPAQDYSSQIYSQPQQQYTQVQQQTSPYARGQSPGVIQLRKEAPVSQKPAPVYTSQPATRTLRGGSSMRGDMKWPPQEYKNQTAAENEERRRIAMGPACRPRRINKDYSQFFAKNALNHYYPGYKIPPGTQHMYNQY